MSEELCERCAMLWIPLETEHEERGGLCWDVCWDSWRDVTGHDLIHCSEWVAELLPRGMASDHLKHRTAKTPYISTEPAFVVAIVLHVLLADHLGCHPVRGTFESSNK